MKNIYDVLDSLGILYTKHEHPAVFTVKEANKYYWGEESAHNKNLFLTNKKRDTYYLVSIEATKRLDLKQFAKILNETKMSFASPERLMEYLGLTPGSVSPYGLINDKDHKVKVIFDEDLLTYPKQSFHPNINTATLYISTDDFKKYLLWVGNSVTYMKL